jgi:hypothetical protein
MRMINFALGSFHENTSIGGCRLSENRLNTVSQNVTEIRDMMHEQKMERIRKELRWEERKTNYLTNVSTIVDPKCYSCVLIEYIGGLRLDGGSVRSPSLGLSLLVNRRALASTVGCI